MAKFLVWADLHDEFWNALPEIPRSVGDIDALLIAGDISTGGRHVDLALLLWDQLRRPVVMVRGNHEFYGARMDEVIAAEGYRVAELNALGADIRVLDGDVTEVAGTRIIGATLWTDLRLFPGETAATRAAVQSTLNDFGRIQVAAGRRFDPDAWLELHARDRDAIFRHLTTPFDGPTVVMSHYMPIAEMIDPARNARSRGERLANAGFASDLSHMIREHDIACWISGHSHDNMRACLEGAYGPIEFLGNSRGYPQEGTTFDPGLVLQTETVPDRIRTRQSARCAAVARAEIDLDPA